MNSLKKILQLIYQVFLFLYWVVKLLLRNLPNFLKGFGQVFHIIGAALNQGRQRIKRLFRFSITFKITVVYALIISILLFLSNASILLGFRFFLLEQINKDVERYNQLIQTYYLTEADQIPQGKLKDFAIQENIQIHIFNQEKEILYTTEADLEEVQFLTQLDSPTVVGQTFNGSMVLNRPVSIESQVLFIQVDKDMKTENVYIQILALVLLIVNGISVIIILAIGSNVSRRMLKPIENMTETVKNITIQDLNKRLDVRGSQDELKELAETFNQMFDGIQASYDRQNQFVSDASHELRTPISVIQGYANLLDRWGKDDKAVLEESITAIKDESENMKFLIEKLLFLARSDKGLQKLEMEAFSLNELVDEVVKETRLIDSQHEIICESKDLITVYADRKSLKQALRIFIDNSVKFTPTGGKIKLDIYQMKKHILIVIEDTGMGIPKEDIPRIFDRFYRSDKSRTKSSGGHGLGLSIAKWIIEKHRGRIEVESVVQVGTKIKIFLPSLEQKHSML